MNEILIKNALAVTDGGLVENCFIRLAEGRIQAVSTTCPEIGADAEIIDAQGDYVSAGFIDIHTHGAGGADFMDGTVEAYLTAAKVHAEHGTTSLYPTTLTSTDELLYETFDTYRKAVKDNAEGANLLGLHLEGPYFAYAQRGAQDPRFLRNPEPAEYEEILSRSEDIARWSLAPELPGALALGRRCVEKGILPAMAHTDATFEEAQAAFESGFTHLTHFYSCMSTVSRRHAYRHAGVVEFGYYEDGATLEIIADGIHVPAALLKLLLKIKGSRHIALVTDSMRGAGMPEGPSILGSLKDGQEVIVEDGVAKLLDRSAFAGSVATGDRCVRTMVRLAGCTVPEAVRMMTDTPARIMGIQDRKGRLKPGWDADVILFDADIRIRQTIIGGRTVYRK